MIVSSGETGFIQHSRAKVTHRQRTQKLSFQLLIQPGAAPSARRDL
jgi:hypothetical protein